MRQGDAGSVQDGLSQLMVVGLGCIGGGLEGVPDLLAALEGRCCVPELVPFAPQLPVGHGVVTLPLQPLLLQGLVAPWAGQKGQVEHLRGQAAAGPLSRPSLASSLPTLPSSGS